jgi:predicted ATPase
MLRRIQQSVGAVEQDEADEYFRKSIDIARTQNAKSLELRATMSLARLWLVQSRRSEARHALQKIMNSFSEGFNTRDLREAQLLLQQL